MHARRSLIAFALVLVPFAANLGAAAPAHRPNTSRGGKRQADACVSKPSKWQREQCEFYTHSAPGDEYFGPLKISYLGIDNTAHDVAIEAGAYTIDPRLIARVHFADLALRDWERKYPGDPQLARSYFLMAEVLRKIYTQPAQREAFSYMQHVVYSFPGTYFAKVLRADLARGFTEHWFALPEICPTPFPVNQRGREEPTPIATPAATPSPRPAPGQPTIDVITPPCVQPATPSPSPVP
jgi:hypothetical protein